MKATSSSMPGVIRWVFSSHNFCGILTFCHSRLSDDALAWNVTHHEYYAHMPERMPAQMASKSTSVPNLPKAQQPLVGPQAVRFDTFLMLRWTLMAHGGYVTYPHKDANGLCTWIFVHVGVKVWAIFEPTCLSPDHDSCRGQFKLHEQIMGAPLTWDYEKVSDMYTTFLAPGDLLYGCCFDSHITLLTISGSGSCLQEHGMQYIQQHHASPVEAISSAMICCT